MSVIYVLVPLALIIVGAAIAAWVWAVKRGQYDDMSTPPVRMLNDDAGEGEGKGE